jgi:uncharacterized protein
MTTPAELIAPMGNAEFDELDSILDDLRTRYDETPQWEFCEGFLAALICCRRVVHASEYLPVLLDLKTTDNQSGEGSFADEAQAAHFMDLWVRRWNEVAQALNTEVQDLSDERAYYPEVVDVRGALARLPPGERGEDPDETLPSFGQVWALGFMYAVESWSEEWVPPRDKKAAKWLDESLSAIVAMTDDDTGPPQVSTFDDDGPPSVSKARLDHFGDAVWAVYNLRDVWRDVGERVETVVREARPGRNDPCFCGSGKKYKKCHGA